MLKGKLKQNANSRLAIASLKVDGADLQSMWCNGSTRHLGCWGGVRIAHILLAGE